jgi:hypothetical protein
MASVRFAARRGYLDGSCDPTPCTVESLRSNLNYGEGMKINIGLRGIALIALLSTALAQGQNLFVTGGNGGPNEWSILKFAPDGTSSIFASKNELGSPPSGLAFDSAGNLFEAGYGGNIYEFTLAGAQSTFASGLGHLYGLAFNSAGDLYVAAGWPSGNIYRFTPQGGSSTFASGLNGPYGLAFNSTGDLFVSDENDGNIYKYNPDGSRSTFASGLRYPTGLVFDSAGNLFASQGSTTYPNGSGSITKFMLNGGSATFASGDLGNLPYGLAFDSADNLFLASADILKFAPDGTRSIFATGMDSPQFLAFQGMTLPVPEPSTSAMVMLGPIVILVNLQRRRSS